MQFGNPLWFWGLTGLLIPTAIHLLSRKEGKIIPIGSLRHLKESETAQFSSIRLNELLLLILRCFIIVLVVLFLANPKIDLRNAKKDRWVILEQGIEKQKIFGSLIDSLTKEGYEKHFLVNNFPQAEPDSNQVPNYWRLAEELGKRNIEGIVISYNFLEGFRGERIPKPENIQWIAMEPDQSEFLAKKVGLGNDSVWARKATSNPYETSLETLISRNSRDSMTTEKQDSIQIGIVSSLEFQYDTKIIEASLLTLKSILPLRIIFDINTAPLNKKYDWIIWLSQKKIDEGLKSRTIGIQSCSNRNYSLLISKEEAAGFCNDQKTDWVITRRLTEANAVEENLTLKLASIILSGQQTFVQRSSSVMPPELAWSSQKTKDTSGVSVKDANVNSLLFILILISVGVERWLAFTRKQ